MKKHRQTGQSERYMKETQKTDRTRQREICKKRQTERYMKRQTGQREIHEKTERQTERYTKKQTGQRAIHPKTDRNTREKIEIHEETEETMLKSYRQTKFDISSDILSKNKSEINQVKRERTVRLDIIQPHYTHTQTLRETFFQPVCPCPPALAG